MASASKQHPPDSNKVLEKNDCRVSSGRLEQTPMSPASAGTSQRKKAVTAETLVSKSTTSIQQFVLEVLAGAIRKGNFKNLD